jgi:similar to stage IV sporulation protein
MVGAVLALLALNGLAAPIWVVRVEGTSSLPPAAVRDAALRAGLRPGSLRWRLDLTAVEEHILRSLSELVWADVELRGIVARIKVAEREPLHFLTPGRTPGEVVAARDGVVVSILAVQGEAAVSPGQVVARGDVLLRPPEPTPGRMGAVGVVWARVWYTGQAAVPLVRVQYRATGRAHARWALVVAGREIISRGGRVPFVHYRTDRQEWRLFGERNETWVVELSRETSREMERVDLQLSREQAGFLAQRLAEDQVEDLLNPGARIMDRQVELSQTPTYARVKLTVEVLEQIGVTRMPADVR